MLDSGQLSQLLQSRFPRHHRRRRLEPHDGKDLLPTVHPVMAQQRLRRVATADFLESLRLRREFCQNLGRVRTVGPNLDYRVRPIERVRPPPGPLPLPSPRSTGSQLPPDHRLVRHYSSAPAPP
jgi:hypothetical protein